MSSEYIYELILLYGTLEFYEINWQKADTLFGMILRMYKYYSRSIFLFLLMQPTFYFAIFFMLYTHYNAYAITLFLFKGADIATKMILIKQIFIDKESTPELNAMLAMPLHKFLPYIGLLVYLPLIWLALS